MRRGIDERGPIAAWLIRSRAQFTEPGASRAWTVEDFLRTLHAETGWAPVRTTYARWESGAARPEPENIARVVAFYEARNVAGPEAPVEEPEPSLAAALTALVVELRESREAREATEARLRAVEAELQSLRERREDGAPSARSAPGG